MSLAKHRELLVLGTLSSHPMHGYGLVEVLEHGLGRALGLKRAAAYAVLKRLDERGWVSAREEQQGNLPVRSVYSVTPAGNAALPGLVAACADGPWDSQVPLASLLAHLDRLGPEEQVKVIHGLVEARQDALASLERFRGHEGWAGLAFELMERQLLLELDMLAKAPPVEAS